MQGFLIHVGYPAIIVLAFLEACCIPISSEVIFGFAGVLAYQGHLNLALVIIIGTLTELAGSYVSYAVGRVAERPVIERLGRFVLITRRDITRTERFLAGRGGWAIPVGRVIPQVQWLLDPEIDMVENFRVFGELLRRAIAESTD